MIDRELADEKVANGWIRAWLAFETLAVNEDVVAKALAELITKLEADARAKIYKKNFSAIERRENPTPKIRLAYSQTAELELVAKNFDDLVGIVIEYGPSAIEILEPGQISINIAQAQGILNTVGRIMHQFAAAGLGGIVFVRGQK
jgi:hypothetical protein